MQPDQALNELDAHQAELATLISSTLAEAHVGPLEAHAHFQEMRPLLVRRLREYQVFKHREIFNPAIESGEPARAEAARAMKTSCIAAGDVCQTFFKTWEARDLAACWDSYLASAQEMFAGVRAHMALERREIAAALAELTRRPVGATVR